MYQDGKVKCELCHRYIITIIGRLIKRKVIPSFVSADTTSLLSSQNSQKEVSPTTLVLSIIMIIAFIKTRSKEQGYGFAIGNSASLQT